MRQDKEKPKDEEKPSAEQLKAWKESRHTDDDGTSRGSFGGPAPEPEKDLPATEDK